MQLSSQQLLIIKNSQQSVSWFLRALGKVKHPSAGLLPFYPFKYQKLALNDFRHNRLCVFKKCRQCFSGESMVWGPNGPKRIDQIQAGDLVYSMNRLTGLLEVVPVLEALCNGERECVTVTSKTGHSTVATTDHNYFTWTGEVEAGKLTTDDVLLEVNEPERYGVDVHESEAALLGYMITDGYYGKTMHFTNTSWKYLLDFQRHLYRRFNIRGDIKPHRRDIHTGKVCSWRINIYATIFKDWLKSLGIYGQTKSKKVLPAAVFRWSNKSLATMLNRAWAADGWYSGDHCNEAGIGLESLTALHQIKQLLSRFKVDAKVYPATKHGMPKLRLYGSTSFYNFHNRIGAFGKEPRCQLTKGFFFNRRKGEIKSVKPAGIRQVYDLRVPPHDNYIVDGAVVHNSGISKITGAYALWFAMFHPLKTVLVVSRTDADAMLFLNDNIRFLFRNLPEWMQEVWSPDGKDNEHEIMFPNGSRIRSLSSNQDVLRSNASSLNIIDEAAFIQNMDVLWAAGWPTLQHGGSVIVVSTTNGVGGWYWATWTDSEVGANDFHPIIVNWWDMDWVIEYEDSTSGKHVRLAPTDGLLECTGRTIAHPVYGEIVLDSGKYGPKWSPWLEGQYRGLQEKGETWKFDQEILANFVGSGNTVVDKNVIAHIETTVCDPAIRVTGPQTYVHPVNGEISTIDFTPPVQSEGLWIWKSPVVAKPAKYRGSTQIEPGVPAHAYVAGVDISTGKAKDYHGIEVFDLVEMEQVAEYMGHCLPREFKKIVDRVGRWYNCALLVVERNNGGETFIDEMRYDLMYPRLWRKHDMDDRPRRTASASAAAVRLSDYGFFTSMASKPTLNQFLLNFLRDKPGEGYKIYSRRLHRQLSTYVRKRDRAGKDTGKTEAEDGAGNFDDLVMSCGLALIGAPDAGMTDATNLIPHVHDDFANMYNVTNDPSKFTEVGGQGLLIPVLIQPDLSPEMTIQAQLEAYAMQLGSIPMIDRNLMVPVAKTKHQMPNIYRR